MHISPAGQNINTGSTRVLGNQALGNGACSLNGALLTLGELWLHRELERDSLCRDDVHERSTLLTGEHRGVQFLGEALITAENQTRTGPAERFVNSRGHHIRVGNGRGVQSSGDQPSEVCHVDPEGSTHFIGNISERLEVAVAGVGRPTSNDHLGFVLKRLVSDHIHVDEERLGIHTIRRGVVDLAREVQLHSVCQVPTVS